MFHLSPAALLFLLATTFATTTSVEARYMAIYKTKEVGASAYALIAGDCFNGQVSINGSSSAVKEKTSQGKPTKSYNKFTYAFYQGYNTCTKEDISGSVEVYPSTFTGDKYGATASATITSLRKCSFVKLDNGCDGEFSCKVEPVELKIDATWTATGSPIRSRSVLSYGGKLSSYSGHSKGISRETAVTLQVTINDAPVDLDSDSVYGDLLISMSGDIYIDRNEY